MNRKNLCFVVLSVAALATPVQAQLLKYAYDPSGNTTQRVVSAVAPPQILGQPQPQIVMPGQLGSFSVLVADSSGCAYQWRFFGTNLVGQSRDALLIQNVSTNNQGPYSVVVTNSLGSVTSAVAQLYLDSNRNGLPDSWELTYFGNLNQTAAGDADGDGIPNLQEFWDGTNPTNKTSFRSRLTVLADGGVVNVAPEQANYAQTDTVTLTATPLPSNAFYGWLGDLSGRANPASLLMSTNKSLRACFQCQASVSGLVGWWRGEGDARDFMNGHPGTFYSGTTFQAPSITSTGLVGSAFAMYGTNYIQVVDTIDLRPAQFTLEAWVYPTVQNGSYQTVVARGAAGNDDDAYYLGVVNGSAYFWTKNNGSMYQLNGGSVPVNQWTHLAATFDGSTKRLYVNGLLVNFQTGLGALSYDSQTIPLTIGADWTSGAPAYLFNGLLDEVAFFNRSLSPTEVAGVYQASIGGMCTNRPVFTIPSQWVDATQGQAYTQQVSTVLGTLPVTYSLSAGALPSGLTLSSAGLVTGAPTASGSNVFAVTATDAAGLTTELICGLRVNPQPVVATPPGLLAWWRAENNALDSIGGHNGFLSNNVTFASGKVGQAFSFDGTNAYVAAPDTSFPTGSAPRTVECWMQYAPGGLGNHEPFVYGTPGSASSFYVVIIGNRLYIGQYGGGDTPGSTIATDGNWHHIALTYDGYTAFMYVDGQLDASVRRNYATTLNGSIYLGAFPTFADRFKGQVDELAVYNRALSQAEVQAIYQAGSLGKKAQGPYFNTPSPLADAMVNQAYSQSLSTLFASLPVSYAVVSGALPGGVTLSPQGLLSGTPTNAGAYSFVVRALDSASASNDAPYALSVYAPVAPPPGLVSWWRGEANALDAFGPNNGTLRNAVGFGPGKVGQAFVLDGNSQSVDIPDAPSLRPASFTLETWALINGPSTGIVLGKPLGTGTADSFQMYVNGTTLNAFISDNAGLGPVLNAPFTPASATWYHLAYSFDDASKQQTLYINGVPVTSSQVLKSVGYDTNSLFLGRDSDNGSPAYFFGGRLDEAAIYNRVLSTNELAALFNAGPAGKTAAGPAFATLPVLPVAVVSQAYTQALVLARDTAQSFTLLSGALPPGLNLSPAGLITGTPTTPGNYNFVVRATDAASLNGDQPFSLKVTPRLAAPAGIISWWRAESNTLDSIGSNTGYLVNNATYGPGKVGQGFALGGSGDAIEVEDAPSLRPASVTLEAWVMLFSTSGAQTILAKSFGNSTADSYMLWYENGTLRGAVADQSGAVNLLSAPFTPLLGQWYHFAFTFDDSSKQQILYVNGAPVALSLSNVSIGYDAHPLLIGADDDNNSQTPMVSFLNGRIDEASIYGRALAPAEIAALYSADAAGKSAVGPYITTPSLLPDAAYGLGYTQTVAAVGGTPSVTFALTSGTLPTGLTLSSQGLLSGVPTNLLGVVPGNPTLYNFTVRATDGAGLTASQSFSLKVAAPVASPAGLVSWWRAEGNALDAIGTNNGVALNGTTYAPGRVGQGFALDGINDCISIPDSPSLHPASFTVECWVYFNNVNGIQLILAKPVAGNTLDSFAIWLQNGSLYAVLSDVNNTAPPLTAPWSPAAKQWYHVAFTFDAPTRQQALYLNDVTVASGIADRLPAYDSNPLLLGCDMDYGSRDWFLQGRIDEAALYNRALNAPEVAALYYAGAAGKSTAGPYFTTLPQLPDAIQNQSYTQPLVTARGAAPVVYTLTQGSLPPGLSLSANGLLNGSPSGGGDVSSPHPDTYSFTVRATDANHLFAEQAYTLTVYAPVLAPRGLVGWWRGETNALDKFGVHNGTLMGNAAYAPGRVGNAFSLDGANSYINLGAWSPGTNWTLEAWVSPTSLPGGRRAIFGDLNNCTDWALTLVSGQFNAQVRQPGGCSYSLNSGVTTFPGYWSHVALTCDGTNAMLYVNGQFTAAALVEPNYVADGTNPRIGSDYCCGDYFPGLVDEVSLYNRPLSPAEIAAIYNAGPAGKTLLPPIVLTAVPQPNALTISFLAATGVTYTVQSQTALSSGIWTPLSNILALNTNVAVTFPTTNAPQRFYRVSTTGN